MKLDVEGAESIILPSLNEQIFSQVTLYLEFHVAQIKNDFEENPFVLLNFIFRGLATSNLENLITAAINSIWLSFFVSIIVIGLASAMVITTTYKEQPFLNWLSTTSSLGYAFPGAILAIGVVSFAGGVDSITEKLLAYSQLKVFDSFDDSVGMLMAEALRITQKVNIRQNMSLFEVTESLKEDLEDLTMEPEERVLKTRLFLMATEQQGKFYDRLLKGLDFQ